MEEWEEEEDEVEEEEVEEVVEMEEVTLFIFMFASGFWKKIQNEVILLDEISLKSVEVQYLNSFRVPWCVEETGRLVGRTCIQERRSRFLRWCEYGWILSLLTPFSIPYLSLYLTPLFVLLSTSRVEIVQFDLFDTSKHTNKLIHHVSNFFIFLMLYFSLCNYHLIAFLFSPCLNPFIPLLLLLLFIVQILRFRKSVF